MKRIRLIFTILWHTYRKGCLERGIKRNGAPVSKCISTGGGWYVLDSELPWDVKRLRDDLFSLIEVCKNTGYFCDTCDANHVLLSLGEEEENFYSR